MRTKKKTGDQNSGSFIETARRRQIVECAIDTIAAKGYAQASLGVIAKKAKVSKGVISYHFASKDDLIHQVISHIFGMAQTFMQPPETAQSTASAMLRHYIQSNIAFLRAHRKEVLALVHILTTARDKEGKPLVDAAKYEPVIAGLEEMLRRGQREGDFRKFSTRVMAVAIRGAIDGIPGQMLTHPDLDLDSYDRELTALFDRATRAKSIA
jgi:TetR/AcrR family fatty acid metabolism transcriptional regulator